MTQNKSKITSQTINRKIVTWENDTIPRSVKFDDTYYSKADGLSETQYVFINGNSLPQRWQTMTTCNIGELGFGTGLNFLVTAIQWQKACVQNMQTQNKLNFISFEQYLLSPQEMKKALSRWPQISREANKLSTLWQNAIEKINNQSTGPITIEFDNNITLTVFIGDANEQIHGLNTKIDAWYLDGFAPAKNPELWNNHLLQQVANNTVKNGTFATYTAASFVRQALSQAGFIVERKKGHAGKRHMSFGTLENNHPIGT